MATATLTQTVFNAPYGLDITQTRIFLRGLLSFGAGNYVAGGILPNLGVEAFSPPVPTYLEPLQDVSGANVLIGTYTTPTLINLTGITVSGTTVTLLTNSSKVPSVGQFVTLQNFTNAASFPLNGVTAQVTAATAGTSFVVTVTTTATTVTDNGVAAIVIGPDEESAASISGSGFVYVYNKTNATIQIFQTGYGATSPPTPDALAEYPNGTALTSAILNDIIHFTASWVRQ